MAAARVAVLRVGQGLESRESSFFDDIIFKSPNLFLGFSGNVSFKDPKLWGTCVCVSSVRDVRGDRRIPSPPTPAASCVRSTRAVAVYSARGGGAGRWDLRSPPVAAIEWSRGSCGRASQVGGGAPTGTSLAASKLAKM